MQTSALSGFKRRSFSQNHHCSPAEHDYNRSIHASGLAVSFDPISIILSSEQTYIWSNVISSYVIFIFIMHFHSRRSKIEDKIVTNIMVAEG